MPGCPSDQCRGANDEQAAQITLAHLRCFPQSGLSARRVLFRRKPHPGREVPALVESLSRRSQGLQSRRCDRTNTRDRHQAPDAFLLAGSAKDAELMSCATDALVLISKAIDVDLEGQPVQFIRTKFLAGRVELVMVQN